MIVFQVELVITWAPHRTRAESLFPSPVIEIGDGRNPLGEHGPISGVQKEIRRGQVKLPVQFVCVADQEQAQAVLGRLKSGNRLS